MRAGWELVTWAFLRRCYFYHSDFLSFECIDLNQLAGLSWSGSNLSAWVINYSFGKNAILFDRGKQHQQRQQKHQQQQQENINNNHNNNRNESTKNGRTTAATTTTMTTKTTATSTAATTTMATTTRNTTTWEGKNKTFKVWGKPKRKSLLEKNKENSFCRRKKLFLFWLNSLGRDFKGIGK